MLVDHCLLPENVTVRNKGGDVLHFGLVQPSQDVPFPTKRGRDDSPGVFEEQNVAIVCVDSPESSRTSSGLGKGGNDGTRHEKSPRVWGHVRSILCCNVHRDHLPGHIMLPNGTIEFLSVYAKLDACFLFDESPK